MSVVETMGSQRPIPACTLWNNFGQLFTSPDFLFLSILLVLQVATFYYVCKLDKQIKQKKALILK